MQQITRTANTRPQECTKNKHNIDKLNMHNTEIRWKTKMLQFCQAPNWHFKRSHRGKVQYSESNPGNENRRPVLRPPLPRLKAVELGTGLRNHCQQSQDSVLLMCFWMPEMDISVRCGPRKGYKNVVLYLNLRACMGCMAHKNEGLWKNLCATTHYVFWLLCPV